jgi:hypothetical protein
MRSAQQVIVESRVTAATLDQKRRELETALAVACDDEERDELASEIYGLGRAVARIRRRIAELEGGQLC